MVRRHLLAAIVAGGALGAVGRLSDSWSEPLRLLFVLGSPWVLTAVTIGVLSRTRAKAVRAAATALVASVATYYAIMTAVESRVSLRYGLAMILGWGVLATVVGVIFGAAGAALGSGSSSTRPRAAALVGGTLVGESLLFLSRGAAPESAGLLAAQSAVGVTLSLAYGSRGYRARPAVIACAAAPAALVVDAVARSLMHQYGWGGR
jgi:uncharacterized protein DUF6518